MTNETTAPVVLSKEDMGAIAAAHGCTINVLNKKRREPYINLRYQGFGLYLGKLSTLSQMSKEDFAAKVAAKLAEEQYV